MAPSASTLAGLAILKVNWDELGRDYLENFVPLVVECIRDSPDDRISLPSVQSSLRAKFGLEFPFNPLKLVLQRAARDGYVRREAGVFIRTPKCSAHDFQTKREAVDRVLQRAVTRIREFAASEYGLTWSTEEAEAAILDYLSEFGLEILFAKAEKAPIVQVGRSPRNASFVVSGFLATVSTRDQDAFADIETLVKGTLLANALYLPDPGRVEQKFDRTRIYFDTAFLIAVAGYAGPDRAAPALELVELLSRYGAEMYCFQMTLDEARGILDAAAERLRMGRLRDAFGSTLEYFIANGYSGSDVELMSARLSAQLRGMRIEIDTKPPYEREYQVDEKAFEDHLKAHINYKNPKALLHDIDCVSGVARLRRGHEAFAVETSRALFVTTNSELARATRSFFQKDSPAGAVALCITDYALGNLLWLKNPTKAPDLPRKRLVADAYAAMQPADALWLRYLTEIAHLQQKGDITPDDYYVLRYSLGAKSTLMRLTQGDPDAFTEGTVAEVLDVARENIRADLQQTLRDEAAARRSVEQNLVRYQERETRVASQIAKFSQGTARLLTTLAKMGGLLLLGLGTLYTFPWTLPTINRAWFRVSVYRSSA